MRGVLLRGDVRGGVRGGVLLRGDVRGGVHGGVRIPGLLSRFWGKQLMNEGQIHKEFIQNLLLDGKSNAKPAQT